MVSGPGGRCDRRVLMPPGRKLRCRRLAWGAIVRSPGQSERPTQPVPAQATSNRVHLAVVLTIIPQMGYFLPLVSQKVLSRVSRRNFVATAPAEPEGAECERVEASCPRATWHEARGGAARAAAGAVGRRALHRNPIPARPARRPGAGRGAISASRRPGTGGRDRHVPVHRVAADGQRSIPGVMDHHGLHHGG